VRSSYKAAEVFVRSVLRPGDGPGAEQLLAERLDHARAQAAQAEGAVSMASVAAHEASSILERAAAQASLLPADRLLRRNPG
jgi:hypothetical protein